MKPKIILADDHRIVADALATLLRPDYELSEIVTDGLALLDAIQNFQPDVVVADIEMPRFTGIDALHEIKKRDLKCKVIFLTMHSEPDVIRNALDAGASGYLLKDAAGEELLVAIREVLRGNIYLSPAVTKDLLTTLRETKRKSEHDLTRRQRQVLRLVAEGKTMKEIASRLKISTRTVETYKYEMMRTLGVKNTAELIRFAIRSM